MDTTAYLNSPLGLMTLVGSDAGLSAVSFRAPEGHRPTEIAAVPACLRAAHQQLNAYFGHELRGFDLNYAPVSGTDFQRRVWAMLGRVPYGRTASYLDVAKLVNNPKSVRAVGAANGQNPLAVVWPCHRIVGANGSLTGYAGGLHRKQWLLAFEQPTRQGGLFG